MNNEEKIIGLKTNTEKYMDIMETNKKITQKIKELADKQRDLIDSLLFILIIEEENEEDKDDSA